jgi:hypothetical protein
MTTRLTVGLAVVALLAAGCAGARVAATEKLAGAERAVGDATQSEAALVAAPEMQAAEERLARARTAAAADQWEQAGRLADEAHASADHARAQALAQRSRQATEDMRQNVQRLRQELERAGR